LNHSASFNTSSNHTHTSITQHITFQLSGQTNINHNISPNNTQSRSAHHTHASTFNSFI
ncbi:hypothetical protein LINPERPRIM_LOCUS29944, partial [Linum perenne]